MFERYTKQARRSLFFARYEASQLGSRSIDTPHLLLGLIRDRTSNAYSPLAHLPLDDVRRALVDAVPFVEKLAVSAEIPFSDGAKRVLEHAPEEADALGHSHIGTEHLLLGLLRADDSVAGPTLRAHGVDVEDVRRSAAAMTPESGAPVLPSLNGPAVYAVAPQGSDSLSAWLASIKTLVTELGSTAPDSDHSRRLIARIMGMLDALKPPGQS